MAAERNFKNFVISLVFVIFVSQYECQQTLRKATVYINDGKVTFKTGVIDKNGAAYGTFNETLNSTGWGVLNIKSGYGTSLSDSKILYAAGYLEGLLTAEQMYYEYRNIKHEMIDIVDPTLEKKAIAFFDQQEAWAKMMTSKYNSPFWRHVSYIMSQMDGLYDGYQAIASKSMPMERFGVQFLNGVGDFIDIRHVIEPKLRPNFMKMTKAELNTWIARNGHCSALVKVTGAFEDIFMGHSSWFIYAATNRIYKHYDFNVKDDATAAKQISFSSYPGFLESLDDFYILSSKMVMLQTTNNVFNTSLYDQVIPQSLLAWQRVRVANMMAHSGEEWAKTLALFNSGTYNNQYMVIDLKRVHPNERIDDGALWVTEQIPTYVADGDQTNILREGYWPSYNVPFYEKIYNMSGYPAMVDQQGPEQSYQLAPRAKIFRRDAGKVVDLQSFKNILRYNDYLKDPYSENDACKTICCRGDLNLGQAADGCYDTKVTNYKMALQRQAHAINGPTLGTGLKPFSWSSQFYDSHIGLPYTYNFTFVPMQPGL